MLTHAKNPLINQKPSDKRPPILLTHGILESSTIFAVNSHNVKPKDFSSINLINPTAKELLMIKRDPSSHSLPFLAMNLGHEVWFLNRRGSQGSQRKQDEKPYTAGQDEESESDFPHEDNYEPTVPQEDNDEPKVPQEDNNEPKAPQDFHTYGSGYIDIWAIWNSIRGFFPRGEDKKRLLRLSFDKHFWNYSLDQQAQYDFPKVIDHISKKSNGAKVAVVTHSAGGTINLMALTNFPDLANRLSSAVLWTPGFTAGLKDVFAMSGAIQPLMESYIGSVPPAILTVPIQSLLSLVCASKVLQITACALAVKLTAGDSGGRAPLKPEFMNVLFYPSSSRELGHIYQGSRIHTMKKYDFGSPHYNKLAYGQEEPPPYNLSTIKFEKLSFYVGSTDFIISAEDVRGTTKQLSGK